MLTEAKVGDEKLGWRHDSNKAETTVVRKLGAMMRVVLDAVVRYVAVGCRQYRAIVVVVVTLMACCRCCCGRHGNIGDNTSVAGHWGEHDADGNEKGYQFFDAHVCIMRCYDLARQDVDEPNKSIR